MNALIATLAVPLLLASAAPAIASDSEQDPAPAASSGRDPNRMVCRRVETIGTRLDSKRVCRTAAEWEASRAADRQKIEQTQTQRYKGNSAG